MAALIGQVGEFVEGKEEWSQYVERVEHYFVANDIVAAEKNTRRVSIFNRTPVLQTGGQLGGPSEARREDARGTGCSPDESL